jgi:hypothetical protein
MSSPSPEVRRAYTTACALYLPQSNVTGIDIGFRYETQPSTADSRQAGDNARRSFARAGVNDVLWRERRRTRNTNEVVLRIHVKEKIDQGVLTDAERFPEKIDGVTINVLEAEYQSHAERPVIARNETPPPRAANPLHPGVCVSHSRSGSGTLGLFVRTAGDKNSPVYLLSTQHVLVQSKGAKQEDPIVQPAYLDGGRGPSDVVGGLAAWMLNANGDAAIARLNSHRDVVPEQWQSSEVDTPPVRVGKPRTARLGDIVRKSGAATGYTRGLIDGIGCYKLRHGSGTIAMEGFRIVSVDEGNPDGEEISGAGDSGAVWYADEEGHPGIGLHVAGESSDAPSAEHAIACHLDRVFRELGIAVWEP